MSNIWGFILQTMSVSVAASLILIVKRILEDKLSPRWQYGIWAVLALAILIPLKSGRYAFPTMLLQVEILKGTVEKSMNSAFTKVYVPVENVHAFPYLKESPSSITDWLFVIYMAGVAAFILWHMISYLRLKLYIRRYKNASNELDLQIKNVCLKYGLKSCEAVAIDGFPSAFVCGIFKPVLAVPADRDVDDKVILHELLHLKYRDSMQNVFWCILRAFHWCNPFLQYVFNRIENDMESLCDQRVLELLEGEERRVYGNILLEMANSHYARMPGTSSISNGGKNIASRIKAIARFKRYPKGMAVVSICIAVILASNLFVSGAAAYGQSDYSPSNESELNKAMALARIERCHTMAAALDTYAKGIMLKNGVYIATASSLEKHGELDALMRNRAKNGENPCVIKLYEDMGNISTEYYRVFNIKRKNENEYEAYLAFEGGLVEGKVKKHVYLVPVNVRLEDGWIVEPAGEVIHTESSDAYWNMGIDDAAPAIQQYYYESEYGKITITVSSVYEVDNQVTKQDADESLWYGTGTSINKFDINTNAQFEYVSYDISRVYDYNAKIVSEEADDMVMVAVRSVSDEEPAVELLKIDEFLKELEIDEPYKWSAGNGTNGWSWSVHPVDDEDWSGKVTGGGGGGTTFDEGMEYSMPEYFQAAIIWDGKLMEEAIVKEVQ